MARVSTLVPAEISTRESIDIRTLEQWLSEGLIVHQRDRSGAIRVSILELPAIRALRDERPICSNCRNVRRDPKGGGPCLWCNRRGLFGNCPSCGSVNELLTLDAYHECLSCRTRLGIARAKSLHWKVCHCPTCGHDHPDDCGSCGCCGR